MLHMICGAVGAGKTTYARALSRQLGGLHFSIDQWMVALFGKDSPQPMRWDWVIERVHRCETQMAQMAAQCARLGVPAILDQAFVRVEDRLRLAAFAEKEGFSVQLHFVDVPANERWRRVEARNTERGQTFPLEVPRGVFDFVEKIWQPPTTEEMAAFRGLRVGTQAPY
jgi:predicted kinase